MFSLLRQEDGMNKETKAKRKVSKVGGQPKEGKAGAKESEGNKKGPVIEAGIKTEAPQVKAAPGKAGKASTSDLIARAREGRKRNFNQTWDLVISLKSLDLKKPENRFSFDFPLPAGRGKKTKIVFIADSLLVDAKKHADMAVGKGEIERLAKDKKALRKITKDHDFFLAEAPLMPMIGKSMGAVLGTRGKMPMPVPPKAKVEALIAAARNYVRVSLRNTPVIQVPIGTEGMKDEDVQRNLEAVYNAVKERLPKGKNNIRAVFLKLTMGKPVRLEM
jgi:large subunit ribosomal protein L1